MRWLLCLLLVAALPARAADPITAEEFWARLAQTDTLLASRDPAAAARVLALWADVESVRLADERVLKVDVGWIAAGLAAGSDELPRLQRQVRALLNHHAQMGDAALQEGVSLAALDEVLRDPRFQYEDVPPTPMPTMPAPDNPVLEIPVGEGGPGLTQLILIVVGVVVMVAVVLVTARGLQVQPAALPATDEADDDPTTSGDARSRADGLEASRDYRSAIRYLYLSSLLLLDERGVIRYDRTLTNREHLRQVANRPPLFELLRSVINAFEDVWYGFEPVDERFYREYEEQVEQLRRMVNA